MNSELETANEFLASLSMKISRYLSPQIYKSIFSGQKDVTIHTERKKLTIFFSDIKDFTATTERLQPEQITLLLNEYFTEMSAIALAHGGTIDKHMGDGIMALYNAPYEDPSHALNAVRTALEFQERVIPFSARWEAKLGAPVPAVEKPKPAPAVSKAPEPIKPVVQGATATSTKSPDEMSYQEYRAYRNRQITARKGRAA